MITCDEASIICSKSQYREAGPGERLRLWMHLFVCKRCAAFSKKNRELTQLCSRASLKTLSPEEKDRLKARLKHGGPGKSYP
jgi:hypothetical protein